MASDTQRIHNGRQPTIEAVGSGAERTIGHQQAELRLVDLATHSDAAITSVPAYPFRGELSVSPSPDRRALAIMATTAMIPLGGGTSFPYADDSWEVEKRLGFVALSPASKVRWAIQAPHYPLELFGWSSDSSRVAFRGREPEPDALLRAVGHWGVPTTVFGGEVFFGQDRFDVLMWRLHQAGLARRPDCPM